MSTSGASCHASSTWPVRSRSAAVPRIPIVNSARTNRLSVPSVAVAESVLVAAVSGRARCGVVTVRRSAISGGLWGVSGGGRLAAACAGREAKSDGGGDEPDERPDEPGRERHYLERVGFADAADDEPHGGAERRSYRRLDQRASKRNPPEERPGGDGSEHRTQAGTCSGTEQCAFEKVLTPDAEPERPDGQQGGAKRSSDDRSDGSDAGRDCGNAAEAHELA